MCNSAGFHVGEVELKNKSLKNKIHFNSFKMKLSLEHNKTTIFIEG